MGAGSSLLGTNTSRIIECSGASIEEKLFDLLGNCDQLTIPYEEYEPAVLNGPLYTLEDLKDLYATSQHLQPGADIDSIENTTKANLNGAWERKISSETMTCCRCYPV